MKRTLAFIILGVVIAGCGQKGPLYHPPAKGTGLSQSIDISSPGAWGASN